MNTYSVGASHPTIWKFIDGIKQIQNLEELKREQYNAGEPKIQKKKYKDFTKRIHSLITNYNTNDNRNFLKGIAYVTKSVTKYLIVFFLNYYYH